jgi:mRNA-degrading endonuclease RelE of RelBE toxin-antitoxin system
MFTPRGRDKDLSAMPADPSLYRVLTTPGYERDFHTISRGVSAAVDAMDRVLTILRRDPYNRSRQHQIKKLTGCKAGEGQWRIRWKEYRLRYDILENDVVLYSFRPRKEAY